MVGPSVQAGGRTQVWRPWTGSGRRPAMAWPAGLAEILHGIAGQVRTWAAADFAPGRLVPWLAVAFGCGIVAYFAAAREPALWAALLPFGGSLVVTVLVRRRPFAFPAAVAISAATAGFATATLKCSLIAHPVLLAPAWNVELAGFVEVREERERSDRIVVQVVRSAEPRLNQTLERVRVAVRKGTAPAVGSFVEFKARLSPPLEPLRPGGYEFGRDLYFQRIGASGFVLGRIRTLDPPIQGGAWLRYAAAIDGMREAIDQRIRAVLPGDKGAIASALITGKRDAITTPVNESMYISSLAHVLSISGYHMAVVAGIVFFVLRALMALLPGLADRHQIKKWAAAAALGAATFYLLLSGAEVATQRSYIMISIVLIGVMVDRPALTFRTLTAAALAVLLLAPEAVVHPSFQMSFAATLALVAGYANGMPFLNPSRDSKLAARIALWGGREISGLLFASLLAGTATMPFAAYHFHRLAPYGTIANLLAMPVVSVWVMPMGILGVLAMPFGFDGFFWKMMGDGLDWMIAVALWVTSLPGAVGRMAAFGSGTLLLGTAGLLLLCLLRSPLRLAGVLVLALATLCAIRTQQPDILVAPDGSAVAVRTATGRLAVVRTGNDTFTVKEWLAADADARGPKDPSLSEGMTCDSVGCIGRLPDGALIAIVKSIAAFEEDCRRAQLVISAREAPPDCAATTIDRLTWQRNGAMGLRSVGGNFEVTAARPTGYGRPWATGQAFESSAPGRTAANGPREATPDPDDLEPGD
jgi:competence protein ComEC